MGEGGKGRRVAAASKVMLVSGNQVPSGVTPSAVRCGRQVGFISSRPYREFIVFNRLRVSPELSWNGGTARAFVTGGPAGAAAAAGGRATASSDPRWLRTTSVGGYSWGGHDAAMTIGRTRTERKRGREGERC